MKVSRLAHLPSDIEETSPSSEPGSAASPLRCDLPCSCELEPLCKQILSQKGNARGICRGMCKLMSQSACCNQKLSRALSSGSEWHCETKRSSTECFSPELCIDCNGISIFARLSNIHLHAEHCSALRHGRSCSFTLRTFVSDSSQNESLQYQSLCTLACHCTSIDAASINAQRCNK